MALRQYTVTIAATNVEQRVVTVHTPICFMRIQNDLGNNPILYGTNALTAANYAGHVLANTAIAGPLLVDNSVTIGPFPHGIMNLDDFYFMGTINQVFHLTIITP